MARRRRFPLLAIVFACWASLHLLAGILVGPTFVGSTTSQSRAKKKTRRAGGLDLSSLGDIAKDPEKMRMMQREMEDALRDPTKRAAVEEWQRQAEAAVAKLKEDPDLETFLRDIEQNGMDALAKLQGDEELSRKLVQALGASEQMAALVGSLPSLPSAVMRQTQPGDEVIITGLTKAPELNGKHAVVVPPTQDETESIAGTARVVVRLVDGNGQFAVKLENLRAAGKTPDDQKDLPPNGASDSSAMHGQAARLRDSGKLQDLDLKPELQPVLEDLRKNGMDALGKYVHDKKLMAKVAEALGDAA